MKPAHIITLLLTGAVVIVVLWLYHWTVGAPRLLTGQQGDYYNLLVDGFQEGSLAMKATPDPWLGVDNTKVRHFLQDASFHRGKYYLYFGVTPVLVLLWPWAAVTGHDLTEAMAVALLAGAAFLLSVGWLATLRRHFFPHVGAVPWVAAVVFLGLAPGYLVVLRRPQFYETAILSGLVFSFAGLWCLTLAVLRRERAGLWLGAASLCAGLAAGSRPTLIPGAVLSVGLAAVLLGWREWRERGRAQAGVVLRLAAAAVLPVGGCGLALAWYNWARFGSPFDFGLLHQVAANANGFPFTVQFLWKNLIVYYLTPPDLSWFFPFFSPGPKPLGSYQEQVHGQFYVLPLFLLAIARGITAWRRGGVGPHLKMVVAVTAVWAGGGFVFVAMAWAHANRYMLDFHPLFVVLTLLGLFACTGPERGWRRLAGGAAAWGVFVVFFNLCTHFHVHGFFKQEQPEQYARIARVANRLVWPLHQLAGPRLGGVEVVVRFANGRPGEYEPLLVAGGGPDRDAIMVEYMSADRGRLVFMHLGHAELAGAEFDLVPGRARWLKIHLGSLYPPPGHPWYDRQPPGMVRAVNRVAVQLDNEFVLERDAVCFPASANQVSLGHRAGFPIGAARFSGTVERVRGLGGDRDWLNNLRQGAEAVRLTLLLPRDRYGAEEPLLLIGERGEADLVSVTYVRERVVRFSAWHPGWPAPRHSADLACDYALPLELLISHSALRGAGGSRVQGEPGLQLEVDGQPVLVEKFAAMSVEPHQTYVGCLPWSMGPSRLMFGGQVLEQVRLREAPSPEIRARVNLLAGRPVHLEIQMPAEGAWPNQPLLTTGIVGRGDGLFLEQAGADRVVVGFDHWGSAPLRSEPVALTPGIRHHLKVLFGAKLSRQATVRGRLRVELAGRAALDAEVDFFPAEPAQVFFGTNPIGMSTSQPAVTGTLRVLDQRPDEAGEARATANP